MSPRPAVPVLAVLILSAPAAVPAVRACDSSSCSILTRGQGGVLRKGAFSIDLTYRYTDQSKRLAGSSDTEDVVIPRIDFDGQRILPGFHTEQAGSMKTLQADLAFGITDRLTAQASLPLSTRKSFAHSHLSAEPEPGDPHGHEDEAPTIDRDYRTDGLGDASVGLRYALWGAGGARLSVGAAVKLPTGESRAPNTFDGGLHDPMLQPGTGSLDYLLSAQYVRSAGPLAWAASGSQQLATENDLRYRFGHETILGLGVTRTLRAVYSRSLVAASLQVKGHWRGRSRYLGDAVPSTGERMIILSPGLRLTTPGGVGFYAYLQLPLYRYVNEQQLSTRSSILTGISKAF